MIGQIKRIVAERFFGFIYSDGKEYFFHKTDFNGDWFELENSWKNNKPVNVEFEPRSTPKGLRASNITPIE